MAPSSAPPRRFIHELPRQVLSDLLAPRPPPGTAAPISLPDIDWESLAADLDRHTLGVLFHQRLAERGMTGVLPEKVRRRWEADAQHARLQCALQTRDALEISAALRARGIRHAFFKGLLYRETLYRPSWVRLSGDTDLLIEPTQIEPARRTLQDLGLFQASCRDDYTDFRPATPQQIFHTESNHFELAQFVRIHQLVNLPDWLWGPDFVRKAPFDFERRGGEVLFNSAFDVHWALHFAFAGENPLAEVVDAATAEGDHFPGLSLEWSLLITLFKLYFESFDHVHRGFQQVVDLAAMIRHEHAADRWARLAASVERYGLQAAAFYTLSAAEEMSGHGRVPGELLESWARIDERSVANSRDSLDFGDFVPYLAGRRTRSGLGHADG